MDSLALTAAGDLTKLAGSTTQQLRQVAVQFEAQFMELIMKQASDALPGDEGFLDESSALKQFTDLLHGALVEQSAGNMGIADIVYQQMSENFGLK
jgi:Rod binding domain-containing protein